MTEPAVDQDSLDLFSFSLHLLCSPPATRGGCGGIRYRGHVRHADSEKNERYLMERRQLQSGTAPRNAGVFLATCAFHAAAIYWLALQVVTSRDSVHRALEVSFVPTEKPTQPPPPAPIPILLSDAFAERPLMDIPAPEIAMEAGYEPSAAIEAPAPAPATDLAPPEGQGYGPLTKPRVISRPKSLQDRYPRASIRHKESGRPIVKVCITTSGTVDSAELAQSSGYPRLDAAAVDMALDYVFTPAMREGKAVPVCLPYAIDFRLSVGGVRRGL